MPMPTPRGFRGFQGALQGSRGLGPGQQHSPGACMGMALAAPWNLEPGLLRKSGLPDAPPWQKRTHEPVPIILESVGWGFLGACT